MSTAEIVTELPKLNAEERTQVLQRLCELQEADLFHGTRPTDAQKKLLDETLSEFQRHGSTGTPWRAVLRDIRLSSTR